MSTFFWTFWRLVLSKYSPLDILTMLKYIPTISLLLTFGFGFFVTFGVRSILDPCKVMAATETDPRQCENLQVSDDGKAVIFTLLMITRIEACAFLASGILSLYGLFNPTERRPIFLFHAVLFLFAASVHADHIYNEDKIWYVFKPESCMGLLIGDSLIGIMALASFFISFTSADHPKND